MSPSDSYQHPGLKTKALEAMCGAQVSGVLNYSCILDILGKLLSLLLLLFSTKAEVLFYQRYINL